MVTATKIRVKKEYSVAYTTMQYQEKRPLADAIDYATNCYHQQQLFTYEYNTRWDVHNIESLPSSTIFLTHLSLAYAIAPRGRLSYDRAVVIFYDYYTVDVGMCAREIIIAYYRPSSIKLHRSMPSCACVLQCTVIAYGQHVDGQVRGH